MLLDIASLFNCRFIYATIGPSIWLNNAAINTLLHVLGNTHTHTHTFPLGVYLGVELFVAFKWLYKFVSCMRVPLLHMLILSVFKIFTKLMDA